MKLNYLFSLVILIIFVACGNAGQYNNNEIVPVQKIHFGETFAAEISAIIGEISVFQHMRGQYLRFSNDDCGWWLKISWRSGEHFFGDPPRNLFALKSMLPRGNMYGKPPAIGMVGNINQIRPDKRLPSANCQLENAFILKSNAASKTYVNNKWSTCNFFVYGFFFVC